MLCVTGHRPRGPAGRGGATRPALAAAGGAGLQFFASCLSLSAMQTTQSLTQAALQETRRQNALAQLRRRYDELDKLTGQNAAERVEAVRQRRRAS